MVYKKYSPADRARICAWIEGGHFSRRQVAVRTRTPYGTVCSFYRSYCQHNNEIVLPRPRGRKEKKLDAESTAAIQEWIDEDCFITLEEIKTKLEQVHSVDVCRETIRKAIKEFHYSLKRTNPVVRVAITDEYFQYMTEYSAAYLTLQNRNRKIIFIDETGFNVSMRRSYGWSEVGVPVHPQVPSLRTKNITVIAGIDSSQNLFYKVLDGNGNTKSFLAFLEELFAELEGQYILIMDNVKFHHSASVQDYIADAGHELLYLSPYSPFFNPIEYFFEEWKSHVKKAASETEDQLLHAIDDVSTVVTKEHIRNYFFHVHDKCIQCLRGDRNLY